MMNWLRWYHGTVSDPKWRVIAQKTGQPVAIVVAIWAALMENASQSETRGTLSGWNAEDIAACLDISIETVETVCNAMQRKVLSGDLLIAWEKRNPKREREDSSTERVQRFREKQRQETPGNAKKRLDKTRLDKRRVEEREDSPSPPVVPKIENNSPPPDDAATEKRAAQPDTAADYFFAKHQEYTGAAYVHSVKDFVQLSALRKANKIAARASPDRWEAAVENYFATPLSVWTLADLATRFPAFANSPLDRFGKPVNHAGGKNGKRHEIDNPNDRATAAYLRRAMAETVQPDVSDVRENS